MRTATRKRYSRRARPAPTAQRSRRREEDRGAYHRKHATRWFWIWIFSHVAAVGSFFLISAAPDDETGGLMALTWLVFVAPICGLAGGLAFLLMLWHLVRR